METAAMFRFYLIPIAVLLIVGPWWGPTRGQSRADQAIELLRLTLDCPAKPTVEEQLEPVNAHGTYRTFKTLSFTGDSSTFGVTIKTERRLHDRDANEVEVETSQESYSAAFSSISATDIVGSDAAKNPLLGLSCKNPKCFPSELDAIELPFCDADMAGKAKIAIDILRGAEQTSEQPIAVQFYEHTSATGQDLGSEISGSSAAECLRKCRANGNCNAFTVLHAAEYDACQLKTSFGGLRSDPDTDTGVLLRANPQHAPERASIEPAERPSKPPLWMHNGSFLKLVATGAKREFYYQKPRQGLAEIGVKPGTLLFSGIRSGKIYSGTAYIFNKRCGPIAYRVAGSVSDDDRKVTMAGDAPRVDGNCQIVSTQADTLTFSYEGDN